MDWLPGAGGATGLCRGGRPCASGIDQSAAGGLNRVCTNLQPGITVKELAELTQKSAAQAAPKSGPAAGARTELTMHGRGAGDDGPIITSHARSPHQLAVALRENMVFTLKPSAISEDGNYICTWGDTVVVTAHGGRRLGDRVHDLAVS